MMKFYMEKIIEIITGETFLTIISGTAVYAISQMITEFIINPIKKYNELRQKIGYYITMYCHYYINPYNLLSEKQNVRAKAEYDKASKEMRSTGAELAGYIGRMPSWQKKKKRELEEVMREIIGISNGFFIIHKDIDTTRDNAASHEKIKTILKLDIK